MHGLLRFKVEAALTTCHQVKITRCSSPLCGRPFQLNQFSAKFSGSTEPGQIACPHCGTISAGDSDAVFLTHALSPEEEQAFTAKTSCSGKDTTI
jgi:hypothetical protein